MGTRHLICVFWKGKWYLAQYGQFDGYPEGQGAKIFKFLSVARNIENLKEGLEHHVYEPATEELEAIWAECEAWDAARRADPATSNVWERNMYGINQLYPSLARETSAGVLGLIARAARPEEAPEDGEEGAAAAGTSTAAQPVQAPTERKKIPLHLNLEFANDSLFCEWVYVVDLDQEVLEVYGGSEAKHEAHRFKDVGEPGAPVPGFVCRYTFGELFLTQDVEEFMVKVAAGQENREREEEDRREREEEERKARGEVGRGPTCTGVPVGDDTDEEEEGGKEEDKKEGEEEGGEDDVAHEADVDEGNAKGSS